MERGYKTKTAAKCVLYTKLGKLLASANIKSDKKLKITFTQEPSVKQRKGLYYPVFTMAIS